MIEQVVYIPAAIYFATDIIIKLIIYSFGEGRYYVFLPSSSVIHSEVAIINQTIIALADNTLNLS